MKPTSTAKAAEKKEVQGSNPMPVESAAAYAFRSQIVTGRGCRYIPRAIFRTLLSFQKSDTMFLKGIRKPVTTEVFRKQLLVEGKVPKELNGVYIRTGPNPQFQPLGGYHWFDGEGMVHAVHFQAGQAKSYSNHWLRTKRFLAESDTGRNLFLRFGDQKGLLGYVITTIYKMFSYLLLPFKADLSTMQLGNTALVWHNGKLLALMEAGLPFLMRVCAGAVKSMHAYTFRGGLEHEFTAHPKVDPHTGEMICFAYGQGNLKGVGASVAYFTVSPNGHKGVSHPVDVQATQMMHDFAVTENFAIFMDHAFVFDAKHMRKGNSIPYRTDMKRNSRLGLLQRAAPEAGVKWFEVAPFVAFHAAAAWEEHSNVHVIICRYEALNLANSPESNPPGEPVRYTINVATGAITTTRLMHGYDLEFPVIPLHLVTMPVRMDSIVKVDVTAPEDCGLVATIRLPEGFIGGEFSVVPKHAPAAAHMHAEDDAWLVGYCRHHETHESFCMVYDAKTMSNSPVVKVALPQPVPMGFHGTFLHHDQLLQQNTADSVDDE